MASTPEKLVKNAVVKVLKAHDVYYFFPATHGYGRSGVPDIVCCARGRFLAIECKAPGKKPTALQAKEMNEIGKAGGMALVIDSADVEAFESFLAGIL